MGYSPWGHKESDVTERLNSSSVSGEGPLQGSPPAQKDPQCIPSQLPPLRQGGRPLWLTNMETLTWATFTEGPKPGGFKDMYHAKLHLSRSVVASGWMSGAQGPDWSHPITLYPPHAPTCTGWLIWWTVPAPCLMSRDALHCVQSGFPSGLRRRWIKPMLHGPTFPKSPALWYRALANITLIPLCNSKVILCFDSVKVPCLNILQGIPPREHIKSGSDLGT